MDTSEMRELLQGYLSEVDWSGGASKEVIMRHITDRDDALRTMIEEYLPEGTYADAEQVMTLIPEQAWQDSQGDEWRGAETQYAEDVETHFKESPVGRMEQQGTAGRGGDRGAGSGGQVGDAGANAGEVDPLISGSGETTGTTPPDTGGSGLGNASGGGSQGSAPRSADRPVGDDT